MGSREQTTAMLNQIEQGIKDLEIAYEHYFSGIEKRAPGQQRQKIAGAFRKLLNTHITQNDLKFRLNSLSSRFQSYSGYWDRILRLIDEGRYERHVSRIQRSSSTTTGKSASAPKQSDEAGSNLYEQLINAHESCSMKAPNREQVDRFLAKQEAIIKEKFGDRKVGYRVVTEGGKPKIKVFASN